MTKTKIGEVAIEILEKEKMDGVGYVNFGLMDEIHSLAVERNLTKDTKIPHPLNRHQKVMNSLERDERFEKSYIRCTNGRNEILTRFFKLKKKSCEHRNKDIEIDEKRFFCKDCNKWINCEGLK